MSKMKPKKKPKPGKNKGKKYDKPISLYPLSLEKALEGAMSVSWPPVENKTIRKQTNTR
jgi:hypothetical protein